MSEPERPVDPRQTSPEELGRLLKIAVRRRRPRLTRAVILWLVLLALPLGVFLWWMRPRSPLPPVLVLTFDQTATPGAAVRLRGQLWPAEQSASGDLGGQELFFEDVRLIRPPGQAPWQAQAVTGSDGEATASCEAPPIPGYLEFAVRFPGDRRRRGGEDRARIFTWTADTPLLIVEVETTLTDAPAKAWRTRSTFDIPQLPEAAEALQAAVARKYQIVYLALKPDRPLVYHKVRDWVQVRRPGKEKGLPDGPVLGRPTYAEDAGDTRTLQLVVMELRERFRGPLAAVTRQSTEAKALRDAGLRTFLITKTGPAPPGVIAISAWAELPARLQAP